MKFSKLEQEVIIDLCQWANNKANEFKSTRSFLKEKGFKKGTGLFAFSKEDNQRPPTILCIDMNINKIEDFQAIINHTSFILYFIKKLQKEGLITISEGRYSKDKEYAYGIFTDATILGIEKEKNKEPWSYSFTYIEKQNPLQLHLVGEDCNIQNSKGVALDYHNVELFCRLDIFDLVASNIALDQELIDLANNNFKTKDERMFEKSLCLARIAILVAIVVPLFVTKCTQTKMDYEQFNRIDTNQTKIINNLQIMNSHNIIKDSVCESRIKEFDSISSISKNKK